MFACLFVVQFSLTYMNDRGELVALLLVTVPTYCTLSASGPSSLFSPLFAPLPLLPYTYIYIINSLFPSPSPVRFAFSLVQQEVLSCSALSATLLALI
jgi:hypothetical protein